MLTIHKASAGSGKTYALTYTYIKLLLGDKDPMTGNYSLVKTAKGRHRAILAITFTNKATDEMKSRIIARLSELATRRDCEYQDNLCKELHCRLTDLQDRARQALSSLLTDYSQFNVATIDSFFQGVLRTFARELNISSSYEVDLDTSHAITVGVKEMLASVNRSSGAAEQRRHVQLLTKWLSDYMHEQLAAGNNVNIFRQSGTTGEIASFVKNNLNETYRLNARHIKAYTGDITRISRFNAALRRASEAIENELRRHIDLLNDTVDRYGFDTGYFNRNAYRNILRWASGNYEVKDTAKVYDAPPAKRYVADKKKTRLFDIIDDVDRAFADTLRYGVENLPHLELYRNVRKDLFNLGIIADVEQKTSDYLLENQAILLDSTQDMLQRIISRDETPFIYERLGMQLRHFLIDEFQDTSRLQWLNLSPLVEDSVDSGNDNLIIGDEKQSIYRFRNADPELISSIVPTQFDGRADIRGTKGSENTNYRSAWHIVGFNNTLFSSLAAESGASDVYANVVQTIKKTDLPGYVTMTPYDNVNSSLQNMADNIRRQLDAGYRQRDIAILTDTRSQGRLAVNYLLDLAATDPRFKGLQIVTQEALRISAAPSVHRIVSILRFIDSIQSVNNTASGHMTPQQQLAAVINRYELLRSQGLEKGQALVEAFDDTAASLDTSSLEITSGEYATLPTIVESIIQKFVDDTERDTDNIYLSAFQDLVATYVARGTRGLHQFIKWWDETGSGISVDVPPGTDAITVMTIHKSKGLEFACVHIPMLNWPRPKGNKAEYLWFRLRDIDTGATADEFSDAAVFDPDDVPPMMPLRISSKIPYMSLRPQYDAYMHDQAVDTLNKTYVAFTRAARELIIGYAPKSSTAASIIKALRHTDDHYKTLSDEVLNFSEDTAPLLYPYIDDDGIFSFGAPTSPASSISGPTTTLMPPYVSYSNPDIWRLNTLDGLEDLLTARHEGIVLHDIMANIRHTADVPRAVRHSVMRGFLPPLRCDEVIGLITKAVTSPEAIRWFEGYRRVIIERPIANVHLTDHFIKSGRRIPHNRPDRVVWLPDGSIEVIDYKFGDDHTTYTSQVRDYMRYIGMCFPEATALRGFLWHPVTGEMRLVTPQH